MKTSLLFTTILALLLFFCGYSQPSHTVILIMENHNASSILGNSYAPYINSLCTDPQTALMTNSFAITHPSQPNYLAFFSGSTQGVIDDNVPAGLPFSAMNLGAALVNKGFTFTGYSEDLPSVGFTGATYAAYVRKHNPWVNWQGSGPNGLPANTNRPLSDFPADFAQLPTVSVIVPNLNNDMHDGSISQGDSWVQAHLSNYIQWAKNNNSLFILTFDEDGGTDNRVVTLLTGQNISGGSYSQKINHYNLLRTVEDWYHTAYAGISADSSDIKNLFIAAGALPLFTFNARVKNNEVVLNWTSDDQVFNLERSADGISYTRLSVVTANSFTDATPLEGNNFYRLRKENGVILGTKKVYVTLPFSLNIYPNPGVHGTVTIVLHGISQHRLYIYDISGKVVYQAIAGSTVQVSGLKPGTYLLDADGRTMKFSIGN